MDAFFLEKKIYYHDTDCGGVVYYANYLKYLEEARTEFFLSKGIVLKKWADTGIHFVVARVEIDYKSPVRYQETIKILTKIKSVGRVALEFSQEITKDSVLAVKAHTTLVCVGKGFKPVRIPDEIKTLL
ncbi:MAG TPA: acyl-CoA thioesterase [Nitrospiraceae bacterium]|jgi:acyl-CoA thioester hydrolase|nr:acyl-CoA thioesterase [Nitrospiraceae bacterium]